MTNIDSELRRRIERYLRRTGTAATRFGREAVNDPCFVSDLRRGRKIGAAIAGRVHAWLDKARKRVR